MSYAHTRSYEHHLCRLFGHRWRPHPPMHTEGGKGAWLVVLTCDQCAMQRSDRVTRSGFVVSRSYAQPEGYRIDGDHQPTRQQWRRRWLS